WQRPEMNSEVRIRRVWNEDLYLILAAIDDPAALVAGGNPRPMVTFAILINPLVAWIWTGGIIVAFGTLVAMWPSAPGGSVPAEGLVRAPATQARRDPDVVEV